jgi:hypothetical protein
MHWRANVHSQVDAEIAAELEKVDRALHNSTRSQVWLKPKAKAATPQTASKPPRFVCASGEMNPAVCQNGMTMVCFWWSRVANEPKEFVSRALDTNSNEFRLVRQTCSGRPAEKRRTDLFRHWVLGLGAGDLVIKVPSQSLQIESPMSCSSITG